MFKIKTYTLNIYSTVPVLLDISGNPNKCWLIILVALVNVLVDNPNEGRRFRAPSKLS